MADLYANLNNVGKKLQGKNATIILARKALLGFQGKLGLYKHYLGHGKFEYLPYFALLNRQTQNAVTECDLLIYINKLDNFELAGNLVFMIYKEWLFLIT